MKAGRSFEVLLSVWPISIYTTPCPRHRKFSSIPLSDLPTSTNIRVLLPNLFMTNFVNNVFNRVCHIVNWGGY
jgi:hypothetical protein